MQLAAPINQTLIETDIEELTTYFDMLKVFLNDDPFGDTILVEELVDQDYQSKISFTSEGNSFEFYINITDQDIEGVLYIDDLMYIVEGKQVVEALEEMGYSVFYPSQIIDEDKAIVTEIEGTTRDTIEAYVNISGVTLNLIDTAGIRETTDVVEKIGVNRSMKALDDAQLVLLVLDQSKLLTKEDKEEIRVKFVEFKDWLWNNYRQDDDFWKDNPYGWQRWESILSFVMAEDHTNLLPDFKEYVNNLDNIRSTDAKAIFPELAHLL